MKKNALMRLMTTGLWLVLIHSASAQAVYTHQVITVNSGKFEFSPPFSDYVNLGHYNPSSQVYENSGTIWTQSAQDILVTGRYAYIAAQDSLVKYDISTWTRVAAIADSGLNKMYIYNNRLIVSKQYPASVYFTEVLDTANLALVAHIAGIPGDCGGITVMNDSVYVAVNGGWMGTEGKLAVIDPSTWTLKHTWNFGAPAIGIFNLYARGNSIFSVNKTPYGAPAAGSVTEFNPATGSFINHLLPVNVGNGWGVKGSLLYLLMNGGIGTYDLNTFQIADTTVIPSPGFPMIISAGVDTVSNRLYTNIGDYSNPGFCLVTNLQGDSITSYLTGVSSEFVGFDHRNYPLGIATTGSSNDVVLYPNPATDHVTIKIAGSLECALLTLLNSSGQVVETLRFSAGTTKITIPVSGLAPGIYLARMQSETGTRSGRFIKK